MRNNLFVIDTNTLISAFLFRFSSPGKAFDKAIETGSLVASRETDDEFSDVLLRSKFDKYVPLDERRLVLKKFKELAIFIDISERITECRDPKDNKFLELAVVAIAACIITGDSDLLILHPFRNIPILNAIDFINTF